jgi:RecB family exonuclease
VHALAGDGFVLHLKGTIDLLYVDAEGVATVLDYKHTNARGRSADVYAFQLDCYLLAVRSFMPQEVQVKSGIAFLRDRGDPPSFRQPSRADLERFKGTLLGLARDALVSAATSTWSGHERPVCEAMGCGYVYRCHAAPSAKAGAGGRLEATAGP